MNHYSTYSVMIVVSRRAVQSHAQKWHVKIVYVQ